ncbi:uncharacterized protein FMAN_14230 [Fusarium mangiferae]|uniref:Uncharacterized protein n=1 Tax=Fusarium mangiferae TaxID=192010 RepID=A0A1L7ULK0_FUSMA|nr:uncharacterized protein FMAN_14230 [Fusarium mangiferae]CVL08106.1 uncharacterized protein FMAN_14230 [Fusarium mangiferae]
MAIKPIQAFNLNKENGDADFLPILCSFLSLLYGTRRTPWLTPSEMTFCRTQLEKFGPQQFTANLRDRLFSQMSMAIMPWSSTRYALQGHFEIASKIMTRKGNPFKILREIPSHPVDRSKQDILRHVNKVGRFNIPLEEINDSNVDAILVLCIGLLGGERGEAFVIEQVVHIAPIALSYAEHHTNNPLFFGPVVSPPPIAPLFQQPLPSPASPAGRSITRGRCRRRSLSHSRSRSRSRESSRSTDRSCAPPSGSWRHDFHTWIASVNIYKFGGVLFITGGLLFYMLALFLSSSRIIVLRMEM